MRTFTFNLVNNIGGIVLASIEFICFTLVKIITFLSNKCIAFASFIIMNLLRMIDSNQVNHAEIAYEQQTEIGELDTLFSVSQVKDDALKRGTWTEDHSLLMNQLSSKLYNEFGWSEQRVHSYMRGVIESIPGLIYSGAPEGDDDSTDLIDPFGDG